MNPFENEEFAATFKTFCDSIFPPWRNKTTYRNFVDALNSTCRETGLLILWQQEVWEEFVRAYPQYAHISFDYLWPPDLSCPVHNVLLKRDRLRVSYGLFEIDGDYLDARDVRFPFAETEVLGGCTIGDKKHVDVSYCPECRREEKVWAKSHRSSKE